MVESINPYEFLAYSKANLVSALARDDLNNEALISSKPHIEHIDSLLKFLGTKWLVVEHFYVDQYFLRDYNRLYVGSFNRYRRQCRRIHFFKGCEDKPAIEAIFSNDGLRDHVEQQIQDDYLGFIVGRPLPKTAIGHTCLPAPIPRSTSKPLVTVAQNEQDNSIPIDRMPGQEGSDKFPTLVRCRTNLYGVILNVRTLPFVEQDYEVGVCAASALWTAFKKTRVVYPHRDMALADITTAGTSRLPHRGRKFSGDGLSIDQMADAVRHVGLEPHLVFRKDRDVLAANVYAYLNGGIPLVLTLKLVETGVKKAENKAITNEMGKHAVALAGYRISGNRREVRYCENGEERTIFLRGARLNGLFVHDDGIAPFAPMPFYPKNSEAHGNLTLNHTNEDEVDGAPENEGGGPPGAYLETNWTSTNLRDLDLEHASVIAETRGLLIPLHRAIRIPFSYILEVVKDIDIRLNKLVKDIEFEQKASEKPFFQIITTSDPYEWDIELMDLRAFKTDILKNMKDIPGDFGRKVLQGTISPYLWRVRAFTKQNDAERLAFEILLDATDLLQGKWFAGFVPYYPEHSAHILDYAISLDKTFPSDHKDRCSQWFRVLAALAKWAEENVIMGQNDKEDDPADET